jgi:NAD(P)-dependent dehydrogenase (short-subunit alcohol dehydrogenase family)
MHRHGPAAALLAALGIASWREYRRHTLQNSTPTAEGEGRVCVVTGGASGIGLATALALLRLGCSVVAMDRCGMKHLAEQWEDERPTSSSLASPASPSLRRVRLDLAVPGSVQDAVRLCGPGRVDVLVHCAGVNHEKPLLDSSDAELQQIFSVNVLGPLALTRGLLPNLVQAAKAARQRPRARRRTSRVIFVGSIAGDMAWPWGGGYSSTKAALVGACATMRREMLANKLPIEVSLVSPGPIKTPMTNDLSKRQVAWANAHVGRSLFANGLLQSARQTLEKADSPAAAAAFASAENVAAVICHFAIDPYPPPSHTVASFAFHKFLAVLKRLPVRWTDLVLSKI